MTPFGTFSPGSNAQMGLALLKQIQGLQGKGNSTAPAPGALDANGMPNFVGNGMIAKLMSGNPGGLIGALLNRNPPVNPGPAPAAGSPAYVPGGDGPAMPAMAPAATGGGMPGFGLLSKLTGSPSPMPDLGGFAGF